MSLLDHHVLYVLFEELLAIRDLNLMVLYLRHLLLDLSHLFYHLIDLALELSYLALGLVMLLGSLFVGLALDLVYLSLLLNEGGKFRLEAVCRIYLGRGLGSHSLGLQLLMNLLNFLCLHLNCPLLFLDLRLYFTFHGLDVVI